MTRPADEPDATRSGRTASTRERHDEDENPTLPDITGDERGEGWGDEPGRRDADWYRRERPPHHE